MMKNIKALLVAILLNTATIAFGQDVQMHYSNKIDTDTATQLSLKLDNKTYLKIDVQADLSSKKTSSLQLIYS